MAILLYGDDFWVNAIPDLRKSSLTTRIHLVFSLLCFLKVSLYQLLKFSFSSDIKAVKDKASIFMGYNSTGGPWEIDKFPPALMLHLWSTRWPTACHKHFKDMITPYASEIALRESNRLIADPLLRISLKEITIEGVQNLMKPETLITTYRENAPFVFSILHIFAASPNPYRKKKARKEAKDPSMHEMAAWRDVLLSVDESDDEDEVADGEYHIGADSEWKMEYPGFSRNPLLVSSSEVCWVSNFTHIHIRTRQLFYVSVCSHLSAIVPPMCSPSYLDSSSKSVVLAFVSSTCSATPAYVCLLIL
jgi:hypothetical protein